MSSIDILRIVVTFTNLSEYPDNPPFNPPERYPEYTGDGLDPDNYIYSWVRETIYRLGLDEDNFNTPNWNPFKELIVPGMTILIKPNTVRHNHMQNKDIFSVIVHASIIRPILDYICIALQDEGKIIVADSQTIASDFQATMKISQIEDLIAWYRNQSSIPIELIDLRTHQAVKTWYFGEWGRKPVAEDTRGDQLIDLGEKSKFVNIDPTKLRINIANHKNMYKHHSNGRHEYLIPKSVLESDVIINIPKMKTHRRTAVTLAIKNYMGIPAMKDSLPHYRIGSIEEGGDQYIYPSWRKRIHTQFNDQIQSKDAILVKFFYALLKKAIWHSNKIVPFKDNIDEAMWYGNDTLWRTLLDIHKIILFVDKNGKMCEKPQRKQFCLVDGIIGGEKNGPSSPEPVHPGVLIAGTNPAIVDAVTATLMGFDIERIPVIKKALEEYQKLDLVPIGAPRLIEVIEDGVSYSIDEFQDRRNLQFEPHPNWKGRVERTS